MITKSVYAAMAAVVFIVSTAFGVDNFYERRATAQAVYERLAGDQENGRLRTQLDVIEIRLQRFKDLARARALTEEEQIDLRSLEAERAALLNRLAQKS